MGKAMKTKVFSHRNWRLHFQVEFDSYVSVFSENMDSFLTEFILYESNSKKVKKSTRNGDPKMFLTNVLFLY